jgi:DNA invertase Pin-like site-specific DNA recombinase
MAELRDGTARLGRMVRRQQMAATERIRTNREELSLGRGAIYLNGDYAAEETRQSRKRLTREEILKIKELRAQGMSQLAIACQINRSAQTVSRACRQQDIPGVHEPQGGWKAKKDKALRRDALAAHDAGRCGPDCRIGRHGVKPLKLDQP